MFTVACNWMVLSLHIFIEIKLNLVPFNFFTSFEIHFDTSHVPVPSAVNPYPQNNQGERNYYPSISCMYSF